MIIDISITNYLSIKEKITFSFEAGSSKLLNKNVIKTNPRILKSVIVYGANASGKSNLLKSIVFFWNMVAKSTGFNVDTKISRVPYKFDRPSKKKKSEFDINFIHQGTKYNYGFSCDDKKIINEYLYYSPKGRKKLIFRRDNTTKFEFTSDLKKQKSYSDQTIHNTLYLSRATQLGFKKTEPAYDFIKNYIIVNYHVSLGDITTNLIFNKPKYKNKIIKILQGTDFGGISDIITTKKKSKGGKVKIDTDGFSYKEVEEDFIDIDFQHKYLSKKNKEEIVNLKYNEESEGTKKTYHLLGLIFDILENGKTLFFDELDNSLHPNITKFLLKMFNSKNNKGAQLIFTTHNTNLLDNELMRRDQIYICTREPNKWTKIYSLLDFDLRQSHDFEKAYLDGRLGGIPFIDETLVD
jgi:AAA15 family ATPase/GTPase